MLQNIGGISNPPTTSHQAKTSNSQRRKAIEGHTPETLSCFHTLPLLPHACNALRSFLTSLDKTPVVVLLIVIAAQSHDPIFQLALIAVFFAKVTGGVFMIEHRQPLGEGSCANFIAHKRRIFCVYLPPVAQFCTVGKQISRGDSQDSAIAVKRRAQIIGAHAFHVFFRRKVETTRGLSNLLIPSMQLSKIVVTAFGVDDVAHLVRQVFCREMLILLQALRQDTRPRFLVC